ncbi:unnamed protein product [Mucor hiemalis]
MSNALNIQKVMQGIQLVKYGLTSESLVYNKEIPVPNITNPQQVLIQVKAAGINPAEVKAASGNIRLGTMTMSLPCIIGGDFSGVIVSKGDKVTDFEVGDSVFGTQPLPFGMDGTYAEYTVVNIAKAAIAKKPAHLSFEDAASAGIAVLTAYDGIVNNGCVNEEDKKTIVVVGASGGVGSYAIQIAKAMHPGNIVIAICSNKNTEFVKSFGIDQVIDYNNKDTYEAFIEKMKDSVDLIFDCVGGNSYFDALEPLLKKEGIYSSAVGPIEHVGSSYVGLSTVVSMISKIIYKKLFSNHKYTMVSGISLDQFGTKIAPLFEDKQIRGPIVRDNNNTSIYGLETVYLAHEKINSHRAVGKLVLKIE